MSLVEQQRSTFRDMLVDRDAPGNRVSCHSVCGDAGAGELQVQIYRQGRVTE